MKIGHPWETEKIAETDWVTVAGRLGIGQDAEVERVRTLRAGIPEAFHGAASEDIVPESLRDHAKRIADLVEAHVENRRDPWGRVTP